MLTQQLYDDRAGASQAAAAFLSNQLSQAVLERGKALCALSGGTSPIVAYNKLRDRNLPWEHIKVTLTDERLVPVTHPDSNAGMLLRELLIGDASAANFISLYRGTHLFPQTESDLRSLSKPYDVVLLGMGEDGHVASLFPNAPGLAEKLQSTNASELAVTTHQEAVRITLTPHELLNARHIALLFFGSAKRDVYDKALAGDDVVELPVRFVLNQDKVPVTLFWAP